MDIQQRRDILQREISAYVRRGFIVQSQTDTTAQLIKRKKFSLLWAIIWFLLAVFPFVIYLIWYAAKRDESAYLTVDETGRVRRQ